MLILKGQTLYLLLLTSAPLLLKSHFSIFYQLLIWSIANHKPCHCKLHKNCRRLWTWSTLPLLFFNTWISGQSLSPKLLSLVQQERNSRQSLRMTFQRLFTHMQKSARFCLSKIDRQCLWSNCLLSHYVYNAS